MRSVKFEKLSFRDLVGEILLIEYPLHNLIQDCGDIQIPKDADGALVYGYIDAREGFTLEILAPARMSDTHVFFDYSFMTALKVSAKIRIGSLEETTTVVFPGNPESLKTDFSNHIALIEDSYKVDDGRLETRNDATIDHLRHPYYPDDIQAILYDERAGTEVVWFTLMGYTADGELYGELLNEPEGDFGIHSGDGMALIKQQDEQNILLVTVPALRVWESQTN